MFLGKVTLDNLLEPVEPLALGQRIGETRRGAERRFEHFHVHRAL